MSDAKDEIVKNSEVLSAVHPNCFQISLKNPIANPIAIELFSSVFCFPSIPHVGVYGEDYGEP
jgi:hypothetical protein